MSVFHFPSYKNIYLFSLLLSSILLLISLPYPGFLWPWFPVTDLTCPLNSFTLSSVTFFWSVLISFSSISSFPLSIFFLKDAYEMVLPLISKRSISKNSWSLIVNFSSSLGTLHTLSGSVVHAYCFIYIKCYLLYFIYIEFVLWQRVITFPEWFTLGHRISSKFHLDWRMIISVTWFYTCSFYASQQFIRHKKIVQTPLFSCIKFSPCIPSFLWMYFSPRI